MPANPAVPKNTPAGVQIVVTTASGTLSSSALATFLGGPIQVTGELSGPGLTAAITLPVAASGGGAPIVDPLILPLPALTEAGDYTLTNLKILVNGVPTLDVNPSTVPLKVIDQVLITSVETTPLTLDQIKAAGIVLDSNDFLGFQFTIGLATSSNATTISFPAVFDRNGVAIPSTLTPPLPPVRADVPVPTIQPVMLALEGFCSGPGCANPVQPKLPNGTPVQPRIPGVLVIPGDVGFLKQFFSAKLFVANGSPGGSGLVVHDVNSTISLPPSPGPATPPPLSLPDLKGAAQPGTKQVLGIGPDGQPDVNALNPGDQGQAEFIVRGDQEGYSPISFAIQGTLDGLATGPVKITGSAQGGVLVRNPFFDMTFAVPGIVRSGEQFKVVVTVKNLSQTTANVIKVTIDQSRLSGASLVNGADATQTIPTLAGGGATMLTYLLQSQIAGQVVASYLHFDTSDGSTGELKFTLGVGQRGIPLSPDTLVLPASVDNLPQPVVEAAMLVLGEGWSIANAPAGTLPASVIRTNKAVVTQKALALAEAGLRVKLGEHVEKALRDLLYDFYGGNPIDPGFDQLLRTTDAGQNFERAVGAALAQPVSSLGVVNFQQDWSNVLASGPDFISLALTSGSAPPPVTFSLVDGNGHAANTIGTTPITSNVVGFAQAPLGNVDASPILGVVTAPTSFPYTLQLAGNASGTLDFSITMPHADGNFINGQISGVPIRPNLSGRVVLDISQPDRLVLELDTNNDGTFATQKPLTTTIIHSGGPEFLSANIIGPETLPGATALGVQAALLFDRVVDGTAAQQPANYQIPSNAVQQAKAQLSGRIVVANLQQPEGKYIPTTMSVTNMADSRGAVGPSATQPLGTQTLDPGAVVSGHVLNADGTPASTAVVVYGQAVPRPDCLEDPSIVGVSAIPVNGDGRYEVRYVRQDQCGLPFSMSTTDPNTGGLRQVGNFVRFGGQQIVMDIELFGRGSVTGTVKDSAGNPAPGATVVVFSSTDTQIGAQTTTDGNGQYSVTGITVGPVTVQAARGTGVGHSAGNIPRSGGTAVVNVTLDSGAVSVSGTLFRQDSGSPTPSAVPNWPVVYSIDVPVAVVHTDAAGNFVFTGVPEGNFTISAQLTALDAGFITGHAKAGDQLTKQNLTIAIKSQGTINGKVTLPDGVTGVGGAIVTANGGGVLSAADGTYSLQASVEPALTLVSAITRDGQRAGQAKVLLNQPGQVVNGANIFLSGLGTAKFKVLDGSGQPVVNQPVAMACFASPCGCGPVVTGPDGVASFSPVPVGPFPAIAVSSSDVATGTATISSDGGTGFAVLQFHGTGSVTGSVVDPANKASQGATVALNANVLDPASCSVSSGLAQQVQTDANGNFKFAGVLAGPVGVTASQAFLNTNAEVGARGVLSNAQTLNFNLQLVNTISGVFAGTVFLPDGVTPAGAGVEVTASGPLPDVTVSTDAGSRFQFAKIFPQGIYTVTARDPVTGGVVQENVFLPAGQDITHNFRLKGRGTVTVQVVDGSNNSVDNASVKLTEITFPNNEQEAAIQPSNQGTVTFQEVFEGPFSVTVADNVGRGGRASSVLPGPGATINVVAHLTSTGTVEGHFYMPDGATPIPLGNVSLTANSRQIGQVTTSSGADPGFFSFAFVPAGPVLLQAQDPVTARVGVAAGTISDNGQILTLNLIAQGLGTVQGFVTSNGVNQAGANVDISSGDFHASTSSDSTGHYLVSGVPLGHVVVNASFTNNFLFGTNSATLSSDGAQIEIDVALRGSGSIQGTVVQSDGKTPAPSTLVTVSVGGPGGGSQSASTDASGNFSFAVVPEGVATVTAASLSSIDQGQSVVDVTAASTLQTTVRLEGVGSITGHTQNSTGNPIAGHLTVTGTGVFPYTFVLDTGNDGAFSLPQVLAGNFTANLTVVTGTIIASGTTFASVTPNAGTDINVRLQPTGSVTGTVLRADNTTPAAGANVTIAVNSAQSVVVQAQTDGSFAATGIPVGPFSVRISDPAGTGQAFIQGQSISAAGQTVDLGRIVLNETPMSVVAFDPPDGASGVLTDKAISITFSNPLRSIAGIVISSPFGQLFLTGSVSPDGKVATFTGNLPASAAITVSVTASVTDTFGRHALPATATFFTGPPFVTAIVPAQGAIQIASNSQITVTFSEPLSAATNFANLITVSGSSGPIAGSTVFAPPVQAIFTPAAALPINSVISVTVNGAVDSAGNAQIFGFFSSFATLDTVPPFLQVEEPAKGTFANSSRPFIFINAFDAVSGLNTTSLKISIDGQPTFAPGSFFFTPPTILSDGLHTILASVADRAGNVATANSIFGVDTQPPTAPQITGITDAQTVRGVVPLSLSATDTGSGVQSISLLLDSGINIGNVNTPFTFRFDTTLFPDGDHVLNAQAADAAGNLSAVTSLHFAIQNNLNSGTITGRVFLPDGATAVGGATVRLNGAAGPARTTAADGSYRFDAIPLGIYTVDALDSSGLVRAHQTGVPLLNPSAVVTQNLLFIGLGSVTGTVLQGNGTPAAGITVSAQSQNPQLSLVLNGSTDGNGVYNIGGVPVGAFSVIAQSFGSQLAAEGTGTIKANADMETVNLTLASNTIPLPVNLLDANSKLYDLQKNGSLGQGSFNVFQGSSADITGGFLLDLVTSGTPVRFTGADLGTTQQQAREIAIQDSSVAGLNATRKVFVPTGGYFARYLEILNNPTTSPITVDVRVTTNFNDSAAPGQIFATSSGDAVLDVSSATNPDRWVVPAGAPLAFVFDGAGGARRVGQATVTHANNFGRASFAWQSVTVPAGGTVAFMHFGAQQANDQSAQASAVRLVQLPPEALAGLTPDEIGEIQNFAVPANGLSALAPLPPFTGQISGRTVLSDGRPSPFANVSFSSNSPIFQQSQFVNSDASGSFGFSGVPVDAFTLTASNLNTGTVTVGGNFPSGQTSLNKNVAFVTGDIQGSVSRANGSRNTCVSQVEVSGNFGVVDFPILDANGNYASFGLSPGNYTVQTLSSCLGSVGGQAQVQVVAGQTATANIVLAALATVQVTVLHADGTPAAGAQVAKCGSFFCSASVTTDQSGSALFFSVPQGGFLVTAQNGTPLTTIAIGSGVVRAVDDGQVVHLTLTQVSAGSQVAGTVFAGDGSTPVAGAQVQLIDTASGIPISSVFSDSNGAYSFTNILTQNPGFTVSAQALGQSAQQSGTFAGPGDSKTVNLTLPLGILRGRATYFDGTPVPFPNVFATQANGSTIIPLSKDANGNFAFMGLATGNFTVTDTEVSLNASVAGTITTVAVPVNFNITLPPSGTVKGKVFDAGGAPAASVVSLTQRTFGLNTNAIGGQYEFDHVPLGTFDVTVDSSTAGTGLLSQDGQTVNLDINLPSPASVSGTVFNADGVTSAAFAKVQLSATNSTQTDISGHYILNTLAGPSIITATDSSGNAAAVSVVTGAGSNIVNLTLRSGAVFGSSIFSSVSNFNLDGTDGFRYDIDCGGTVAGGGPIGQFAFPAVSAAWSLSINGVSFPCVPGASLDLNGREVTMTAVNSSLNVTRRIFVPAGGKFVRYVEVLTNPTSTPVAASVEIDATEGGTSCGEGCSIAPVHLLTDPATTGNTFAMTTQDQGCCVVADVLEDGKGRMNVSGVHFVDPTLSYHWDNLIIQPGLSVSFVHFGVQRAAADQAGAQAEAQALVSLTDPDALAGLGPSDLAQILNFNAAGSASISGTANVKVTVLGSNGSALPGAEVVLQNSAGSVVEGPTAADGTVAFLNVATGAFSVTAYANGFAGSASGSVQSSDVGGTVSITITAPLVGTVQGTVFAGDGKTAVSGADVELIDFANGEALAATSTDTSGFYQFPSVATGALGVKVLAFSRVAPSATAEQTTSLATNGGTAVVNLVLPISVLQGTVFFFDGTTPVANPNIFLSVVEASGNLQSLFPNSTDAKGNYTFVGVPPGNFSITAQDNASGLEATAAFVLPSGTTPAVFNLSLPAAGTVNGTITDSDGSPAAHAQVSIADAGNAFVNVVFTDAQGNYQFANIAVGAFLVEVSSSSSQKSLSRLGTLSTNAQTDQMNVTLPGTGTVNGAVFESDGVTPAGFATVVAQSGLFRFSADADNHGHYQITGIPAGDLQVSTSFPGAVGQTSLAAGQTATLNLTAGNAAAPLGTVSFFGGLDGFAYVVRGDGSLENGGSIDGSALPSPFSRGADSLTIAAAPAFPTFPVGATEIGGRQLVLGPGDVDALKISRKVFVPTGGVFTRYLEIISNTGTAPVTVAFGQQTPASGQVTINRGSGSDTSFVVEPDSGLCGLCNLPNFAEVMAGPGASVPVSTLDVQPGAGLIIYQWNQVTIPAGGTIIFMHFLAQGNPGNLAGLEAEVQALENLTDANALTGMSALEKSEVVNFKSMALTGSLAKPLELWAQNWLARSWSRLPVAVRQPAHYIGFGQSSFIPSVAAPVLGAQRPAFLIKVRDIAAELSIRREPEKAGSVTGTTCCVAQRVEGGQR